MNRPGRTTHSPGSAQSARRRRALRRHDTAEYRDEPHHRRASAQLQRRHTARTTEQRVHCFHGETGFPIRSGKEFIERLRENPGALSIAFSKSAAPITSAQQCCSRRRGSTSGKRSSSLSRAPAKQSPRSSAAMWMRSRRARRRCCRRSNPASCGDRGSRAETSEWRDVRRAGMEGTRSKRGVRELARHRRTARTLRREQIAYWDGSSRGSYSPTSGCARSRIAAGNRTI